MEDVGVKRSRTNEQVSRENRWNELEQTHWSRNIFVQSIGCRFVRLPIAVKNQLNDTSHFRAVIYTDFYVSLIINIFYP